MLPEIKVIVPGLDTAPFVSVGQFKNYDRVVDLEGIQDYEDPKTQIAILESVMRLWNELKNGKRILLWGPRDRAALIAVLILSHDLTPDLAARKVKQILGDNVLNKMPLKENVNA